MNRIEQKHLIALDCLRQFANEYFSVFEKFVQDPESTPQENHATARKQIRLAEELHDILEVSSC